jgi:hypothetical protein
MIEIRQISASDPLQFEVTVRDPGSQTRHRVTVSASDYRKLAGPTACSPEQLVKAAFRFLLEREPKESILRRFDLMVIAQYFPEFEERLPGYFSADP